jgi:hypothetical protein
VIIFLPLIVRISPLENESIDGERARSVEK